MALAIPDNRIITLYRHYANALMALYDENEARALARVVFDELLGISTAYLLSEPNHLLTESEILTVHFAFKDLLKGKPIQYITGKAYFRKLSLHVEPGVLIPRPETEELVGLVVEEIKHKRGLRILDIGTGSGCISISLAKELKNADVYATDVKDKALFVAKKNTENHDCNVTFLKNDILDPTHWHALPTHLDLVVSNPPYVLESEKKEMHSNVVDFEPPEALFVTDEDPLIFYKAIARVTQTLLIPGGKLYFEINEKLGKETAYLLKEAGYDGIMIMNDFRGKQRFIRAIMP